MFPEPVWPARLMLTLLASAALATLPGTQAGAMGVGGHAQSTRDEGEYVPNEVIVGFHPGVTDARAREVLGGLALVVSKDLGMDHTYLVRITDGTPVPQMIERLGTLPEVRYAEPNRITRLDPLERPQPAPPQTAPKAAAPN